MTIGIVNWALPATASNGDMVFGWIVNFGKTSSISKELLICTGFARILLLGVSMNCGFVGGAVFPFFTMGVIAGTVMYRNNPHIPLGLCISTFMVALPAAIMPMPFALTALVLSVFFFGLYQAAPIFVAAFTAYLLLGGSGLFKRIVDSTKASRSKEGTVTEENEYAHIDSNLSPSSKSIHLKI